MFIEFNNNSYLCGFEGLYCWKAFWRVMVLSIDRYRDGNKYLNVLELNISNIGRAAAK